MNMRLWQTLLGMTKGTYPPIDYMGASVVAQHAKIDALIQHWR